MIMFNHFVNFDYFFNIDFNYLDQFDQVDLITLIRQVEPETETISECDYLDYKN